MTVYVIKNKDNDQLFWNADSQTWVEIGEDFFTQLDRDNLTLPESGEWAVVNDPFGEMTRLNNQAFALECSDDMLFTNRNGNLPTYNYLKDRASKLRKAMEL